MVACNSSTWERQEGKEWGKEVSLSVLVASIVDNFYNMLVFIWRQYVLNIFSFELAHGSMLQNNTPLILLPQALLSSQSQEPP